MKIAVYCRVSTDKEEQKSSLKHQKEYLKSLYPNDEVTIFYDEGQTGTNIRRRKGFQEMLVACGLKKVYTTKTKFVFELDEYRESKFDKIVTKSITRFARNTEAVTIWRLLEQKGVSIFFQDINKDTASSEDSLLLKLLLTLSEEESRNISERTKWGNEASAKANKIRNNELYGYEFNRETNSLIAIEKEAEVVRLMFKLCIEGNGYRIISSKLTEMNVLNRKGKSFSASTIKNMLHNKKYCGFNVRGQWQSVGLFTEDHTYKRTKKEEWIVQKNDRIEPIISEETFEKAHKVISERLLHGNKGKNMSKRDTQGKIICAKCGKSYYICHSKSLGRAVNTNPYYICATKKNKGKAVCNAENLSLKQVENYLEELRVHYYDNIELRNKIKIQQLKDELSRITNATDQEVLSKIDDNNLAINIRQETIDQLLDKFLSNATESTKKLVEKKISTIEEEISKLEADNSSLDELLINREAEKNKIKHKIYLLEKELLVSHDELTRVELMDKLVSIEVHSKKVLVPVWKM